MTNRQVYHLQTLADLPAQPPTFVAIGSFDGVHLGHQTILRQMITAARKAQMQTAVLTFFPHPRRLTQQLTGPYYLATLDQRIQLLKQLGLDVIVTHPFNEAIRSMSADAFVTQLCDALGMVELWGGRIVLGRNREGTVPYLRQLGQSLGFTVQTVETLTMWNGRIVNSSRIRESLATGDIPDANGCLKRPYQLCGPVVEGDRRGRTIGFPTANLATWPEQIHPQHGVYAARTVINGNPYIAAVNIGVRPTVDGQQLRVEAHILDFKGDLYGQTLCLDLIQQIRQEQRFSGLEALKAQIAADIAQIRTLLAEAT